MIFLFVFSINYYTRGTHLVVVDIDTWTLRDALQWRRVLSLKKQSRKRTHNKMENDLNYTWSSTDIVNLLEGTQHLVQDRQSCHNSYALLLCNPRFITFLIEQLYRQNSSNNNGKLQNLCNAHLVNIDGSRVSWKENAGLLSWLLTKSRQYVLDSNDDTAASIFLSETSNSTAFLHSHPPPDHVRAFINWFPILTLENIRGNLNGLTLFIETLPQPEDKEKGDVEYNNFTDKQVVKWKSFNKKRTCPLTLSIVNNNKKFQKW